MTPAEDERDNVLNVAPHVEWVANALYEYLPGLSRGTGEPQPAARLEFTAVDLVPGAAKAFEAALGAAQSGSQGETLWYRMVAGGPLRAMSGCVPARPGGGSRGQERAGPADAVNRLIAKTTVEIWTLRPTMSLGVRAEVTHGAASRPPCPASK